MFKYVFSFQQLVSEYINGSIHILNRNLILSVQDKTYIYILFDSDQLFNYVIIFFFYVGMFANNNQ